MTVLSQVVRPVPKRCINGFPGKGGRKPIASMELARSGVDELLPPEPVKKGAGSGLKPLPNPRMGRPKGAKGKLTKTMTNAARRGLLASIDGGRTPLEVMLMRMRDPKTVTNQAFQAAVAAAPYCHSKRLAVAHIQLPDRQKLDLSKLSAAQLDQLEEIIKTGALSVDSMEMFNMPRSSAVIGTVPRDDMMIEHDGGQDDD